MLFLALIASLPAETAGLDRQTIPKHEWGYVYYLSLEHLSEEDAARYSKVLPFVVSSVSSQQIIEHSVPQKVEGYLYRIDLRDLKWDHRQWHEVVLKYPYSDKALPLVINGDWLIQKITDTSRSDAYYRLLYNDKDIDRKGFFAFWGVNDREKRFSFGHLEGDSGVALEKTRVLKTFPIETRTYHWGTEDSAKVVGDSDPLEHLDRDKLRHEAEEHIVGMPKFSLRHGFRGALQAYLLSDDKGNRQEVAPPDIVRDRTNIRGDGSIRNVISCISCHVEGLRPPSIDAYAEYLKSGATHYSDKETLEDIKLFYAQQVVNQIDKDNELYIGALEIINGLTPRENAEEYRWAIERYDEPLTVEEVGMAFFTDEEEIMLALSYYSANGYHLGARLSLLAEGGDIPRASFEAQYLIIRDALRYWRAK